MRPLRSLSPSTGPAVCGGSADHPVDRGGPADVVIGARGGQHRGERLLPSAIGCPAQQPFLHGVERDSLPGPVHTHTSAFWSSKPPRKPDGSCTSRGLSQLAHADHQDSRTPVAGDPQAGPGVLGWAFSIRSQQCPHEPTRLQARQLIHSDRHHRRQRR